jgi:hypothetical protein
MKNINKFNSSTEVTQHQLDLDTLRAEGLALARADRKVMKGNRPGKTHRIIGNLLAGALIIGVPAGVITGVVATVRGSEQDASAAQNKMSLQRQKIAAMVETQGAKLGTTTQPIKALHVSKQDRKFVSDDFFVEGGIINEHPITSRRKVNDGTYTAIPLPNDLTAEQSDGPSIHLLPTGPGGVPTAVFGPGNTDDGHEGLNFQVTDYEKSEELADSSVFIASNVELADTQASVYTVEQDGRSAYWVHIDSTNKSVSSDAALLVSVTKHH